MFASAIHKHMDKHMDLKYIWSILYFNFVGLIKVICFYFVIEIQVIEIRVFEIDLKFFVLIFLWPWQK